MIQNKNISALLLAAGQSSRMRGIKQLLPWKGTFLLQHALNTLIKLGLEKVFVVLGANSEKIRHQLDFESQLVEVIHNPTWDKGLGNSISVGIEHILKDNVEVAGVLVCLADQPLVTDTYFKRLQSHFETSIYPIVASNYKNRVGVPAIFSGTVLNELLSLDSDFGAKHILTKYQSSLVALDTNSILKDIDTPEEYEKLYNEHHHQ
ncbi:nucleotidyltransferase family protein [Maribacter sp. PR1]|uniref:Nucleotidyltransferase family protein n=1 Tax=Maribacter cobaltidurans TaxID=1178778 RepID=A0ABU7ITE9_9FLAO|nr:MULTISPECIES: nucleotidyltransferase family protein [Maribacter]MDC6388514.1 nucleotidyltransferase family protein [Maribacter sp. PR1]MEE1975903.1 nucleotidyltransferase family protein [Maribacter cobaltidurans]